MWPSSDFQDFPDLKTIFGNSRTFQDFQDLYKPCKNVHTNYNNQKQFIQSCICFFLVTRETYQLPKMLTPCVFHYQNVAQCYIVQYDIKPYLAAEQSHFVSDDIVANVMACVFMVAAVLFWCRTSNWWSISNRFYEILPATKRG